jgi:hypothetical protein
MNYRNLTLVFIVLMSSFAQAAEAKMEAKETVLFSKDVGNNTQLAVVRGPDRNPEVMRGIMNTAVLDKAATIYPYWIEVRRPNEVPAMIWHGWQAELKEKRGGGFEVLDLWFDPDQRWVMATMNDGFLIILEFKFGMNGGLRGTDLGGNWSLAAAVLPFTRQEVQVEIRKNNKGLLEIEVIDFRFKREMIQHTIFQEQAKEWKFKAVKQWKEKFGKGVTTEFQSGQ